jgi:nascent polypeptide-associated complex subunit alpha
MMPRNVDPRTLKRMMKQLGIKTEELDDVHEIIMKTPSKRYVFKNPQVTMVEAQGQKTFQVVGEPKILEGPAPEGDEAEAGPSIPEEDVKLVAEKAGVSEGEARKALIECNGEPAEAIIKLMSR